MTEITIVKPPEIPVSPPMTEKGVSGQSQSSFGNILTTAMDRVNSLQLEADEAVNELAAGTQKDIHGTMIAIEKAEVSFKLMMQVRNKIIAAYEEIMRMHV